MELTVWTRPFRLKVGQAVRLSIGTKGGGAPREYGVQLSRLGPVAAPARGAHRVAGGAAWN
jgi:hypothetical protein